MKFVLYNNLGVFALCATICLTTPMMVLERPPSYPILAWVVGGVLFLLDVSCRVRLYWVEPTSKDKVLSFLSATGGGQFLGLPIWLWGCVLITEMLWPRSFWSLFAIAPLSTLIRR